MSEDNEPTSGDEKVGGLPADDSLTAFSTAANSAFGTSPRRTRRPQEEGPPASSRGPREAPKPRQTATTRRAAPSFTPGAAVDLDADGETEIVVPNLGKPGTKATACLVSIESTVRDRFGNYQTTMKHESGREPSNAIVVRRAFKQARKNDSFHDLLDAVTARAQVVDEDEDGDDLDGLLGPVEGRRGTRGRVKNSVQQSFRPSLQELAVYDAFAEGYGFPSRSDFINAILDAFLPELPRPRRASRERSMAASSANSAAAKRGTAAKEDQPIAAE